MTYKPVDAAIAMVVGPVIDDTDFKTLEEAITYDAAGMDVSLIVEKTDGTTAVTAITLTTAGVNDWTHKDGGYYEIEITAAQNIEEGVGYIRGVCTGVLPFESSHYDIVKANIYDSLIKGTDVLQADLTQIGGVAQSATDLKDMADTGYDPITHKVQGVVLCDTTTTNTDMRGTDSANTVVPDAAGVVPTAAENADAVWDEILTGATHNIATSAGRRVREIGAYAIESGTSQAGNGYSITLAATASAIDGTYNRNLLVITGNTGIGQTRTVVDYDGTTKVAVIDRPWKTSPDATSEYQIVPDDTPLVVDHGLAQAGTASTITLRAIASAIDDTYDHGAVIAIVAGTGEGQSRLISGYVGSTKVATVSEDWVTIPDATSVYIVMPYGCSCVGNVDDRALTQIREEMDANSTKMAPSQVLADYKADVSALALEASVTGMKGATFDGATDSLEAIRDRGDVAWITGGGGAAPTVGEIRAEMEGAGYFLDLIKADTNELQLNQGNWLTATGFNTTVPDAAGTAAALHATTDGKIDTVEANVDAILIDTSTTLDEMMKRILGLDQENFYIDNPVFTGVHMTSCRIRLYSVAGSVGTALDVLATYNMTATYSGDNLASYKMVKS